MGSRQRRLPHLPLSPRQGSVLLVLVLASVSAATPVTPPASAAQRAPSYRAEFKKLDRGWRVFLGAQKVLAQETQVAEKLCQQAQDFERDPHTAPYAPLIWSQLDTHVQTAARPVLNDTLHYELAALKALGSLHRTFAKLWARKQAKLRVLDRGTRTVLHADSFYSSGLNEILTAFSRWNSHLCDTAQAHVNTANAIMPKGDDALNDGMARLKSLL
jgi:hypothetical protein